MKVLHIAAGNLFGGIEQMLVSLVRAAPLVPEMKPGFALCFEGKLSCALQHAGARPHVLGAVQARFPWTVSRAREKLRLLLETDHWDIVVCHGAWSHAIFASVARKCSAAQVFWLHDVPSRYHWIEKWASLHPPDLAICNSRFTASYLSRVFPHSRFVVNHPISSPAPTSVVPSEIELMRQAGTVTILHATRMQFGKGHRVLLEALSRISSVPGWRCWFVGGPQRPAEVQFAQELSRDCLRLGLGSKVSFLGFREDVPALMSLADLYCQPNDKPEAFGLSFIEALRCGLPVVTSAFGGAMEIVDQSCGRMIEPGNAKELSAVLALLIQDGGLRRNLASAAPARAQALCDPKTRLVELHEVLASVLR